MMIVAAVFETVGIGLIAPFVGVIMNPDMIQENSILLYVYDFFGMQSTKQFIILAVVSLLIVFILKNLYLMLFNYTQFRIILNQQVKLSRRLFNEYLTKPYTFHLQRNTAELLRNINEEVPGVFQGIIMASFQLFTEILVICCILTLLLITAPIATITASILLGSGVILFFFILRKKISELGIEQQRVSGMMIRWVNQGLGASKEVKVSGKERYFIDAYTSQSQTKANNSRYMKMLELVPRVFIETMLVSIVLITMLIIVFQGTSTTHLVSTMALFAMAAFRLMPSITRVVALMSSIRYSQPALTVVYEDLFEQQQKKDQIKKDTIVINKGEKAFNDAIQIHDVSFSYPGQKDYAIKDVSLTIPIGRSVALIGQSGAGKTTLVDLILGLFSPDKGKILIDGKELFAYKSLWQQKIGYIPQSIFLSDDTIRGNVAFGIEESQIDDQEVWRALEQAQMRKVVEALPDQLETTIGEHGVRFSGGQRQRIGIARALYHNPEILFMDEATSALDNDTEKEIMKAIDGLKGEKTLIIIAHRLTTIENCDMVCEINNGRLVTRNDKLPLPS
jgi:ABC-type multidrug transport system fused ATPase/permease subunit